MKRDLLPEAYEAVARSLRDFGYPNATAGLVKIAHERWLAGDKNTDIVDRFAEAQFEEHSDIFGEPETK